MSMRRGGVIISLAYLILVASVSFAQARGGGAIRLKVGDAAIDGSVIKPYKNLFIQSTLMPDGAVREENIFWTDEVYLTNLQGRPLLKRVMMTFRLEDNAILSSGEALFDPQTLAPVSSTETLSFDDYWHMNFLQDGLSGSGVKASPSPGRTLKFIRWKFREPAFDTYNSTFGLLFAALPLKEGFAATLPVVSDDKSAFELLTMHVLGQEIVQVGGGKKFKAFVVEDNAKTGKTVYWLMKEPPFVVKIRKEKIVKGQKLVFTWTTNT
jgi:hypothetical protein